MIIDFFTFIGPNSEAYAEYLKYTCEIFSSGNHEINWKCVESVGASRRTKGFKTVAVTGNAGHNSLSHGVALNEALNHVESDYVVFVDADMAIVHKNWDDIIVNELNNVDFFGVSYNDKIKYPNFPTVYLFAFKGSILANSNISLDFRPSVSTGIDKPNRHIITKEESKYFGMKPGSVLKCDTGWKLPLLIRQAGYTSKSMPMVMMGAKNCQLPFEDKKHRDLCMKKPEHMYEWHYPDTGKVFATHKQASRTQPIDGVWGNAWKRRIDLYIKGELKNAKI